MGLTARKAQTWRARSRAGVALVVLVAWFGTLLVAAPTSSPASAAPVGLTISGPMVATGAEATPTWTFTLPADEVGAPTDVTPAGSPDTATATIETTHRPLCFFGTALPSPPAYAPCAITTGTSGTTASWSFTSDPLTSDGDYTLWVHDREVQTETTTTYPADGGTPTQSSRVISTTDGSPDAVSAPYSFTGGTPSVTFATPAVQPASPSTDPHPVWSFTTSGATTVSCSLSPSVVAAGPCTNSFDVALTTPGSYTLTVTATDGNGDSASASSTYVLQQAAGPGVSTTPAVGKATTVDWTIVPVTGASSMDAVLTGPETTPTVVTYPNLAGSTTKLTTPLPGGANGTWTLAVTATVSGLSSETGTGTYVLDTKAPKLTVSTTAANDPTPTWTIGTDDPALVSCTLNGTLAAGGTFTDGPVNCRAGYTAPTLAEGTYQLTATSTDAVGNLGTATSAPYVYDKTGPVPPVVGSGDNANPGYATGPITWSVQPGGTATDTKSITCVVTYGGQTVDTDTTCGPAITATPTAAQQGVWTVTATAYDAQNNPSTAVTSSTTYDDIAPRLTVTDKTTTPKQPTWHVVVDADATATCSIAGVLTATDCTNTDVTASLTGKDGAVYRLVVAAADKAGQTASTYVDYVLPPDAPVVTVATQGRTAPAWTISAQAGATLRCTLVAPDGTPTTPAVPCQSGMQPPLGADGTWTLKVVASYKNGTADVDSLPGTASFFLDTTAPGLPTVATAPTGATNDGAIRWDVTMPAGDTPVRGAVRVDCDVYFTPVNGTRALHHTITGCQSTTWTLGLTTAAQQGVWQIEAYAVDAVGNTSAAVPGPTITYDISAPSDPVIVGLTTPSNNAQPVLEITTDVGTSLRCAWTVGGAPPAWQPCNPFGTRFDIPAPAVDGTYILNVQAKDTAGNYSAVVTQSYVLDQSAPLAPGFNAPTSPSSSGTVAWVVTPQALASGPEVNYRAECVLLHDNGSGTFVADSGATWAVCAASYPLPSENSYKLQARITDEAGNVGAVGTSTAYTYDKTPPALPTVQGPAVSPSKSQTATWTYAPAKPPADGGTKLQCLFVENGAEVGSFTDCPVSPLIRTDLALNGVYALEVRSVDAAGNASAFVTSDPYEVDNTPPPAPVFSTPAATSKVTTTSWNFDSEAGSTATCQLLLEGSAPNGSNPVTCATGDPWDLKYGEGKYTLKVFVTDKAGNVGPAATSSVYLLDTIPPAAPTSIVGSVSGTANTTSGSYTFTADPGTVSCRLLYAPIGTLVPVQIGTGAYATCTSPWPVNFDKGDGKYQLQLHVTDVAGNVGPDAESAIYTLDTTGPDKATFASQPAGPTARFKDVTWTWTGETPSTGLCTLSFTSLAGVTTSGTTVACDDLTYSTTLGADGAYQLSVQLVDPSGNKGTVALSAVYNLDATAPAAPAVDGPTDTSNDTTADYKLTSSVETGATAECLLFKDKVAIGDFAACTLPRTIDLPGDGSYVLQVRLIDQYGNVGLPGSSLAFLLDTKPPAVPTITAPASPSSNSAPVFAIATDPETTTQCVLTRGAVTVADASCTGSFTGSLSGLTDGDYVLVVTAKDKAGNTSTSQPASYTYDTTKPVAPVVTGPAGPSQTRNPVFGWSGEAGATAECSLQEKAGSAGAWTTCSSPYAPALPSDGTWVLSVRLTDAAKNVSDAGVSGAYVFDTTAPPTPSVTPPTSPGRDLNPSWSAATEEGSKTECRLTGPGQLGAWAPCILPLDTPVSSDGTYTFEVRATDAAGNVSPVGSGTYLLDTTAPAAPVVSQPTGPGRTRSPSIAFSSEQGTTGSCKLTRGTTVLSDSAPCSSPATLDLTGLPDGAYTLSVRAVDAAGNVGPAGNAVYVLDTTAPAAPTMTLVAGSPSSDRSPAYAFNSEPGSTVTCKVTVPGGAVKDLTCSNTVTLDLSNATDGDYVLNVRATDPAGNVSAPATSTFVLDSNAPVAPHVVGPVTPGSNRAPVWKISSASPAECRLVRGTTVVRDWAACGSSYAADLYAQPDGAYVLEARVIGTTAVTQSRYRLDTAGPAAATIVAPPTPGTDRKPTWAVSSTDTTVTAQCRVLVFTGVLKDWAPCGVSPAGSLFSLDLTGAGDGTYTLAVKLTDSAGNAGPEATSDYALDTSAPSAVGVIAPVSPGSDTTPTWTLTSAAGVKLECRVTSGQKVITDFAPCSGTFTANLTGLPDGTYTLTVHALSSAGTPGPETTSGYMLDTTAAGNPGTLSGPTGPSRDRAPKWTFTLPAGTTGLCKATLGTKVVDERPCTSPYTLDLSNAADGTYTITVKAIDAAGNPSSPSTIGYVLKTTAPPAPTYTMLPGSPSSTVTPRWGFSLSRGTTGQCRLLQAGAPLEDWAACTSPVTALLSGKPDGVYAMQVRAVDAAGNTSSPASGGGDYTFDRSAAPLAEFVETPVTPSKDTSPTWVIAAPQPVSTTAPALLRTAALTGTPQTECRLTTAARVVGAWELCSGRYTATTNGDGTYLLEVRAFDSTGERGPVSSSSYLLDTRAPGAPRFVDPLPPAVGNDAEVAWSWADEGNLVECRVLRNGGPLGPFAECDSPHVESLTRLGEGTYTIEARATDAAGNTGPTATSSYRYDITPPAEPGFTSRPAAGGTASSVSWTFPVPVDTRAVCVVTRNGTVISEGACAGAFALDLRGQQPATWTLSVHLVDSAGNSGPASASSYTLTTAIGGGRVDSPGGPGNSDHGGFTPGPGVGAGGPTVPAGSPTNDKPILSGPGADPRPGTAIARSLPETVKKGVKNIARVATGIPGAIPGTDVPKAIKNVINQTITKPQLPLALFVIVLLFLLVQNRIDRRDPKLAAAPMEAEPELTFGPVFRPGGATA